MLIEKKADGSLAVTGNKEHPFTKGFICPKGKRAVEQIFRPDRITTPLIRKRGKKGPLEPASWDEALTVIARQIDKERTQPEKMLHIRGYGMRGVLADAGKYFFRNIGASATRGALCDAAGTEALIANCGTLEQNDPEQLYNAGYVVNWGKDLSRSSIHTSRYIQELRKRKRPVITISPGGDDNQKYSDTHIRIRPGTDRFLAAAVIQKLLIRGYADYGALKKSSNWQLFKEIISGFTQESLQKACDCSASDVNTLANIYSNLDQRPIATLIGWGLQRYEFGGQNVRFISTLAHISGHMGSEGDGVYYGISSGRNFTPQWPAPMQEPPRKLLLPAIGREILQADPPISFLWVEGTNVANQAPDASASIKALEQIPFVVVADAFMNDTVMRADVVLPCALAHERDELIGSSFHNYVNYSRAVFTPQGQARSDFAIFEDLASRLHVPVPFPKQEDLLRSATENPYLEGGYEELREKGWKLAKRPPIAHQTYTYETDDGKFALPTMLHNTPAAPAGYPLHLLTLVNRDHLHSQISENEQQGLPVCWVSPSNPTLGSLDPQRPVYLKTPLGRMQVELQSSEGLYPTAVILRRGGWMKTGHCANPLIEAKITDIGENAAYYSQHAKFEQDTN